MGKKIFDRIIFKLKIIKENAFSDWGQFQHVNSALCSPPRPLNDPQKMRKNNS